METDQLRGQALVVNLSGRIWTKVNWRLDNLLAFNIIIMDEDGPWKSGS